MANPNIVTTTSIYGKTDIMPSVPITMTPITINNQGSNKVLKINTLTVTNRDGQQDQDVHVAHYKFDPVPPGGTVAVYYETYIAFAMVVPQDAAVLVIGKHNPIYLGEGEALALMAGEANKVDAICSYEEIG